MSKWKKQEAWQVRRKLNKAVSWASSQARMEQQQGKPDTKNKFLKKTAWSIERLKDKCFPTEKYENTEDCRGWMNLTQTEVNNQWRELCKEIEEEAMEKYGVAEGKR